MLNFGASKPRVKGGPGPRAPPGSAPESEPIIWPKFAENFMKMKKIGQGRHPKFYYVDLPLISPVKSAQVPSGIVLLCRATLLPLVPTGILLFPLYPLQPCCPWQYFLSLVPLICDYQTLQVSLSTLGYYLAARASPVSLSG